MGKSVEQILFGMEWLIDPFDGVVGEVCEGEIRVWKGDGMCRDDTPVDSFGIH